MNLKVLVTLAVSLVNISGICGGPGSGVGGGPGTGVGGVPNPLNTGAAERQAAEQQRIYQQQAYEAQLRAKEAALLQQQQAEAAVLRQQRIQHQIVELKTDADQKADVAKAAKEAIGRLKEDFMAAKKQIPLDPWRDFDGVKKYVKSPNSSFVTFQGQILQTTSDGIRVKGNLGANLETEFLVQNFPYKFEDGTSIGINPKCAAVENGRFTYLTVSGGVRTIEKLDYGVSCARPKDADVIEAAAQNLTPNEEETINKAKIEAGAKQVEADTAAKKLREFLQQIEDERKAVEAKKTAPMVKALKWNQEQADKGDPYGLLRMGERYRDGDGVPKDMAKARDYLTKAITAGSPSAADELSKLNKNAAQAKQ